ncbi:unnamed protein product [Medioppia subpectinata]|uniref:NADH dehydrogenase [ubiquinone] 1 alpha subcomplex subunit 9, mitochondrial n=1 Tax=Medioppia subpectinata TaxID=1979941 RepID=A0A7R9LEU5_9ACAR|nr:unnamed protein product [Medioppia subpectinata]CAG2117685.1 unnamed protein product [Medioppia subpectinata]
MKTNVNLVQNWKRFATNSAALRPQAFPDVAAKAVKRGSGGRSSFNGQVVTVFGGGGFLGRYVINKLAKSGSQVIIPFRGDFYECFHLKTCGDLGQILFRHFHLKDAESVYNCVKYSNAVVNLIGKDSETNNFRFGDVHVDGARLIARMAREAGVQRVVHVSAANVERELEPQLLWKGSQWLRSKRAGEKAVREEFPMATVIRPTDVHGMDDNWSQYFCSWQRRMLWRVPLINGGFQTQKQPVYVSDVAQALVNALTDDEAPGQTYEAFGPRRYTMRALVDYLQRIIQKTPEDGFHVSNMRWAPLFLVRVWLMSHPQWLHKYPHVSFEKLEREAISDIRTKGVKSIEELGVALTTVEEKWEFNLMHWKRMSYYGEEVGEFPELEKPQQIPIV